MRRSNARNINASRKNIDRLFADINATPQQQRQARFAHLKSLIQRANKETAADIEREMTAQSVAERTGSSARQRPAMQTRVLTKKDLEWMRAYSDNGQPYFYNIRTGISRWRRPEPPANIKRQQNAVVEQQKAEQILRARRDAQEAAQIQIKETSPLPSSSRTNSSNNDPNDSVSHPLKSSIHREIHPSRKLYSQLLSTLLWYRGSVGNGKAPSQTGNGGIRGAGWFYLDKAGQVHGPFESSKMRAWLRAGYFHDRFPVRYGFAAKSEQEHRQKLHEFLPIKCYFPKGITAFPDMNR
jgi:hypothetical protein